MASLAAPAKPLSLTQKALKTRVAVVDYGVGNLFSVKQACEAVGLQAEITSNADAIAAADAVLVPGVGAFGEAMQALRRLDLIGPLIDIAASEKPLIGICLGLQLFMTESFEFGRHKGLGIIEGSVVRFGEPTELARKLKVPHVGWSSIYRTRSEATRGSSKSSWMDSPLAELRDGEPMYFVHSYYVKPEDRELVLSISEYGDTEFCSSLMKDNIFACQFHPERSGFHGLNIYRKLASFIQDRVPARHN
jgi:glutamine amidotransferase